MTLKEIYSYDVGVIPKDNRRWSYRKWDKVWMYSTKHMGWLFVFLFFDKSTKLLYDTGTHFRFHILDEKNKGTEYEECPDFIKREFDYQIRNLVEEGILVKKENKGET